MIWSSGRTRGEKYLDAKGIELSAELKPQLCKVALDPIQIQRVLLNLIRDASGSFRLGLGFQGEQRRLHVRGVRHKLSLCH
jgi:nitrogen-specific signal transduction histidine kinase